MKSQQTKIVDLLSVFRSFSNKHFFTHFLTYPNQITLDLFPKRAYNSLHQLSKAFAVAYLLDGIFTPAIPLFKFLVCKSK